MDQQQRLKEIQERLDQVATEIAKLVETVEQLKKKIEDPADPAANDGKQT